jgi:hypothetical protein
MIVSQSPDLDKLATALALAQAAVKGASKDSVNPQLKNKYADLASVWEACRDALTSNGLSVTQHPGCDGVFATVDTMLLHASGQHITSRLTAPIIPQTYNREAPPMVTAQATIATVTYLRRTALAAVAGVAPEDDDGQAGSQPDAPYAPAQRVPAPVQRVADAFAGKVESVERIAPALSSVDPSCPTCSGTMWDNRPKKASGDANPKSPDFKCKDKACGGVIWKYGEKARGPVPQTRGPLLDAPAPTDEDAPGSPF